MPTLRLHLTYAHREGQNAWTSSLQASWMSRCSHLPDPIACFGLRSLSPPTLPFSFVT
jgi:hypothetical protein